MTTTNGLGGMRPTAGVGNDTGAGETKDPILRDTLSPADQQLRPQIATDQGAQGYAAGAGVQLASMTPSEFWASKLGKCYSKGISPANCTPWS